MWCRSTITKKTITKKFSQSLDNALLVCNFLAKTNTVIMPQTQHSPDLPPCDIFLFPKLKIPAKVRFTTIKMIKMASLEELRVLPKNDCQKRFENWKKCW